MSLPYICAIVCREWFHRVLIDAVNVEEFVHLFISVCYYHDMFISKNCFCHFFLFQ